MSPGHHRPRPRPGAEPVPTRSGSWYLPGVVSAFDRPIRDRLPALVDALGPLPLADLPTPVAPLNGLAAALERGQLWIKSDDLSSPLYDSSPKSTSLGLNGALSCSIYFHKRFEADLQAKYINVQASEKSDKKDNPAFVTLSVSVLMFF